MAVGRIPQKFKISTIFPMNTKHPITSGLQLRHEILQPFQESALALGTSVEFYYSLYSLDPVFRKKWIPKALSPDIVGRAFGMTHTVGRRLTIPTLRIHHALISGENDSVKDAVAICEWVSDNGISAGFNLVRYNSPNEKKSAEASQSAMEAYMDRIRSSGLFDPVQCIQRVGEDVFASCGMFYA
jgi:adenine C2-methylase RlmN of 23S rRNA A2503 and tRNA A37